MFTFTGLFVNLWTWLLLIGMAFVEALVLMLTFNHLAPQATDMGMNLPFVEIGYWTAFSLILFVTTVGRLIQKLTPTIVKVTNSSESSND